MDRVVFWDLDGTLLTTDRAGIFAWQDAAAEIAGCPVDLQDLVTAGLTDTEIARLVLGRCVVDPSPELVTRILRSYASRLPDRLHLRRGRVLPGAREALVMLRERDDVRQYLLTGNLRSCAVAKLRHYGIASYFDDGVFAEDGSDRTSLARRALALASESAGGSIPGERIYVIGDTPHDVRCGKVIEARTIAVASGPFSTAELAAERPWRVLERIPEPLELLGLRS